MKIIKLNSEHDLSADQVNYVHSIIERGKKYPGGIFSLMDTIPIFLLKPDSMPDIDKGDGTKPKTEWLGFYAPCSPILGVETPVIGLCPERIIECSGNEAELKLLTAKVIVHEFAHAMMRHPLTDHTPRDDFYTWMEESMANLITLEYFSNSGHPTVTTATTLLKPFDYVRDFISKQPPEYRLALDLYDHGIRCWRIWRNCKDDIQKMEKEKKEWYVYVRDNVGKTDKLKLEQLSQPLWGS